jgi:gamma-butyrobetaine dioxygenase
MTVESASLAAVHLSFTPEVLRVEWPDGAHAAFPSVWLRDNRTIDRDAGNGQRLVDVADLPAAPRLSAATVDGDSVAIEWSGEEGAARFALCWLRAHGPRSDRRPPELLVHRWLDGAALDARKDFAWLTLQTLADDAARRLGWMQSLLKQGLAFLKGVPTVENAILHAVRRIGLVIETNYGRVFDVRSVPRPENLAYSDAGLGLHTDNPYRDPVPGFQVLHCLIASREGGDNLLADGFAIAEHLRSTDRGGFDLLSETPVPFHYRSKDAELYSERPLIELASDREVRAINYNNRSIAPLPPGPGTERYYAAYRRFAGLLRESRFQLRLRLDDGDLMAFDNRRILHGRTGFSSARFGRHLQGLYLSRDSVLSEAGVLRRRLGGER